LIPAFRAFDTDSMNLSTEALMMKMELKGLRRDFLVGCLMLVAGACTVATAQEAVGTGAEQLAPVHTGIPHDAIFDMTMNGNNGIAIGAFGVILESDDAGASWKKVESGTESALLGMAVAGDKKIIVGQRGTVLVNKPDGGWEPGNSGTEARLLQVGLNNAGLAVAVGEFGTVMRSKDAGRTWEKLTLDWANYREDGYEPHLYAANVDDAGRMVVGGEFSYVIISADGGDTWTLATKGEKSIFSMHFRPDGTGFAVGQEGLVMKSADMGATWETLNPNSNANLFGVWSSKQGEVVVTGQRALLRSSDGGSTWTSSTDTEILRNWFIPIAAGEAGMQAPGGEMVSQVIYIAGHTGRIARLLH